MASTHSASYNRQTASHAQAGGCLSGFLLPPLAVLLVSLLLAAFSGRVPAQNRPVYANASAAASSPGSGSSGIAALFTAEVQWWAGHIQAWAAEAGLDPNLAATVMQIESCGDPQALSRAGASGLFQVMPYHFSAGENPFDPQTNARRGLAYLQRSLRTAGGDPRLGLAGYNGGIGVIGRAESSWANETVRYAYWGSGIYQDALLGAGHSPRLDEWLGRGGASLCRQAAQRLGIEGK
jgi:soluble lytic murein transglycosylase-like protein